MPMEEKLGLHPRTSASVRVLAASGPLAPRPDTYLWLANTVQSWSEHEMRGRSGFHGARAYALALAQRASMGA